MTSRWLTTAGVGAISLSAAMLIASTMPAYAYLDPVSGSFLLQGLIGGLVAASVALRKVWRGIGIKLGLRRQDSSTTEADGVQPRDMR